MAASSQPARETLRFRRELVRPLLDQTDATLARNGLRDSSRRTGPDLESAVIGLGLKLAAGADSHEASVRFVELLVCILAKTPQEQHVLSGYFHDRARELAFFVDFSRPAQPASAFPGPGVPQALQTDGRASPTAGADTARPTSAPAPVASPARAVQAAQPRPATSDAGPSALAAVGTWVENALKWFAGLMQGRGRYARLVRQRLSEAMRPLSLVMAAAPAGRQNTPLDRAIATAMPQREFEDALTLDVARTIDATIAASGLFTPRWQHKTRAIEYLFLIQGLGGRDLEQQRLDLALDRLAAAGLPLARYYYRADPRRLRERMRGAEREERPIELMTLLDRHPASWLVVISSGREFVHPFTLRPVAWASALRAWPRRVLLTPAPRASWSRLEAALHDELGFAVGSSRPAGFADLSKLVATATPVYSRAAPLGPLPPRMLQANELAFLSEFAPPDAEQVRLIAELRSYLGDDGFTLLAACCFYPEARFDLAVHLQNLLGVGNVSADENEDVLARLVSLCWFRQGYLPAWFRRRVRASMPPRDWRKLRRVFAAILHDAMLSDSATPARSPIESRETRLTLDVYSQTHEPGRRAETDGVTLEFMLDGPTRDLDPLLELSPTVAERPVTPSTASITPEVPKPEPVPVPPGPSQSDVVRPTPVAAPTGVATDGPPAPNVEVRELTRVFNDVVKVDQAIFTYRQLDGSMSPERQELIFESGDTVAMIVFDPQAQSVVLLKRFRVPTLVRWRRETPATTDGWIIEAIAGTIGPDDATPDQAVIRETTETTGFVVRDPTFVGKFFSSPGAMSERVFLYFAEQPGAAASGAGRGSGREDVDIVHVKASDLFDLLDAGLVEDPKLAIGGYWLKNHLGARPQPAQSAPDRERSRRAAIAREEIVFEHLFRIYSVTVSLESRGGSMGPEARHLVLSRVDSVAIVIFNADTRSVLLVDQFRLPKLIGNRRSNPLATDGRLLETLVGAITAEETPEQAAIRETFEETGYQIRDPKLISMFYASPGVSSERVFLYFAEVHEADRVGKSRGIGDDDIRLVQVPLDEVFDRLTRGTVEDAKLAIGAYWLRDNQARGAQAGSARANGATRVNPSYQGGGGSRIFISQSNSNNIDAMALAQWLREQGFDDVFLDFDQTGGLAAGDRWERALRDAVNACEVVICLVSRAWLASSWCRAEHTLASQLHKVLLVVLIEDIDVADLPPNLASTGRIVRLVGGGGDQVMIDVTMPASRQQVVMAYSSEGLTRLRAELLRVGIGANYFAWPPENDPGRSPYPGLRPLEAEDAGVFFGRDASIIAGLDQLRGLREAAPPRLMVILGASGAGKSSFLRAGLVPRLLRDDRNFLPLPVIRPERFAISGESGLVRALATACANAGLSRTRADLRAAVEAGAVGVRPVLRALAERSGGSRSDPGPGQKPPVIVLAIDQGEELFHAEGAEQAGHLLALMRDLLVEDAPAVIALVTIRSDSYDLLQSAKALEGVRQTMMSLAPMPLGAYQSVIEGPLRRLQAHGPPFTIEPALTEALLSDIESDGGRDALPLLAFTLERLYLDFGASGRLTRANYEALGGIKGAIEAAVELALRAADADPAIPRDRPARQALLRLGIIPWLAGIDSATGARRRRTALLSEIPPASLPLLQFFVQQRLLVTDTARGTGQATIEFAHEAIVRNWNLLRDWIAEDAALLRTLDGLTQAARDWDANGRRADWLVHFGARLEEIEALLARRPDFMNSLGAGERAYLEAARNRGKRWWRPR